jgi:hypothetical protein
MTSMGLSRKAEAVMLETEPDLVDWKYKTSSEGKALIAGIKCLGKRNTSAAKPINCPTTASWV